MNVNEWSVQLIALLTDNVVVWTLQSIFSRGSMILMKMSAWTLYSQLSEPLNDHWLVSQ